MQQSVAEAGRTYSIDEFVRAFEGREGKAELVDGKVVWLSGPYDVVGAGMIGETLGHAATKLNLALELRGAVARAGAPLVVLGDGMLIRTGPDTLRGPDAAVIRRDELALSERQLVQPVVLCEVLSPSTRRTDTEVKVREYFGLASVMHYLIVDPGALTATAHRRTAGATTSTTFAAGEVVLDGLPGDVRLTFPLASLWVV